MVVKTVIYQQYEAFQEKQNILAALIKRHLKLISSLKMTQSENSLQQLEHRFSNRRAKEKSAQREINSGE